MKKGLVQILSAILILILLGQVVYADVLPPQPTEAPGPTEEGTSPLSLTVVIALGVLVATILLISVWVIGVIKREHSSTHAAQADQA